MIADSLNYIGSKMLKLNNGWMTKIAYVNIPAGTPYIAIPQGVAIINFLKKKSADGTTYVPMQYNENSKGVSTTQAQGLTNGTPIWRFSSGMIYIEPFSNETITNGLMIDAVYYPAKLLSGTQHLDEDLQNPTFVNYAKWRSASQLHSLGSNTTPPWAASELEWKGACLEVIARRFREPTPIQNFRW